LSRAVLPCAGHPLAVIHGFDSYRIVMISGFSFRHNIAEDIIIVKGMLQMLF
jgi:hypothetical protein